MLNMWSACGRVVSAKSNTTSTGSMYIKFTLAIDRQKQKGEEKPKTDYISCGIFGKSCVFFQSYIEIGDTICVTGPMQSGSYEKNGQKINVTECYVLQYSLVKKSGVGANQTQHAAPVQQQPAPPVPPHVTYSPPQVYQAPTQQTVQHCQPVPQPQTWPEPPPENLPFDIYGM